MFLHLLTPGRLPYAEALALQQRIISLRKAGEIADTLLLLEHPPVLTLGRNAKRANILATDEFLAAKGVAIHEVNRGGDVTYHGPGQLIGWPIVDLRGEWPGKKGPHLGPVDFVRLLEEALMRVCGEYGVMTRRVCGRTGVWTLGNAAVAEKKLAAIGVHVSQGITSHGFALNISPDLRDYQWIVPCGIADREVTSLELESPANPLPSFEQVLNATARNLGRILNRQILRANSLEEVLNPDRASFITASS